MLKILPAVMALMGAGATISALLAVALAGQYGLPLSYLWIWYIVPPTFLLGLPSGFAGTVWWARRWNPGTRIGTAIALFLACGAIVMMMFRANIHGFLGLVMPVVVSVLLLGIILLISGLAGRASMDRSTPP